MRWKDELESSLEYAPWPATKAELIDFALRTGAPIGVIEVLRKIDDDGEMFYSIGEFI